MVMFKPMADRTYESSFVLSLSQHRTHAHLSRHWKQVFSQRQRSVQEDDGLTSITAGPTPPPTPITPPSLAPTSKLTCWRRHHHRYVRRQQLHSPQAWRTQVWKKPERERNGRNGRGAANQARDNEQGTPAANQAPPAPNGQSMPQWPTPPPKNNWNVMPTRSLART
jgi:hypothetical protein